jgi:sterol desaturase/sphingolipid hydroxylase (fatty acid hydroxylase superfamily)
MNIFQVLEVAGYASFVIILCELMYSLYKHDSVHSVRDTKSNIITGLILKVSGGWYNTLYFALFTTLFLSFGYAQPETLEVGTMVACIILVDFFYYIFHRIHHSFSLLWTLHSVHHGDSTFNMSTAFRVSWAEQAYIVLFFFIPLFGIGFHPTPIFLAYTFLIFYQFLCHSQYLTFPRFLEYVFITPHSHRIHHSQVMEHQNSNFGGIFSIWDHLFGTYVRDIPSFTPGIAGYHQDNVIKMQTDPILEYMYKRKNRSNNV